MLVLGRGGLGIVVKAHGRLQTVRMLGDVAAGSVKGFKISSINDDMPPQ